MGIYLNPGSKGFRESLNSEIYIDKTRLIDKTNQVINTRQKFMCISRPRRFGKSMAADMLAAYYDSGEDSLELFEHLKISSSNSFRQYLNQYDVIKINMQEFLSTAQNVDEMLTTLQARVIGDLKKKYSDDTDSGQLVFAMQDIFAATRHPFVILIDEWDCLFREYPQNQEVQKKYLDFLRAWLKDKDYIALAYMTGILPIKKYGSHSALNMFTEYSMTDSGELSEYFGFTEQEVRELCHNYQMDFEEAKSWYDGYELLSHSREGDTCYSMYSPKSVVESMLRHKFGTYWNQTETYEALKIYIQMDMDGLKQAVVEMLAGQSVGLNIGTFNNDMTTFTSRDDVLTLLIHLGYLTYNSVKGTVRIPNKEVSQEYLNVISTMDWDGIIHSIQDSKDLLTALWNMDGDQVAAGIERAHEEIAILQYNDENALSCTVQLAFYFAREYYTILRELPTGKGFADICLIPKKLHMDKPAVVIELKWDQSAQGAIRQIKDKRYASVMKDYLDNLLLVGINYDKTTKHHTCLIEKYKDTFNVI